ncbi:MAG: dihydrodipicolinate synthase family protein [Gemmatales bacterium]|nr:dihydrodipicolinate synthase family protein [Gemmatales bacterium]MCS7161042.1 dihydrodipicolinate synthase family protein [Gemmatales bacterium]MDW8176245.1 dihydrodipicolinate synthase family protein [Gemmatales bacterium]MDW8222114.1 dihydrodipicolinate synthase family protein [Gemmatales bacterium]
MRTKFTIVLLTGWFAVLFGLAFSPSTPLAQPRKWSWHGIYPTVLTPWRCDGRVDEDALRCQIEYQLRGGVHGVLVLGTLGEGDYATFEERASVIRTAVATVRQRVPVVVGLHTADIRDALHKAEQARTLGADALLVKYLGDPCPDAERVHQFYQQLSRADTLPIFYYHFPGQTGLYLSPLELARILSLPNVIGIKTSTLDLAETRTLISLTQGQGKVFLSGTALNLTQYLETGGQGAMCPEAVLLPCHTVAVYEAYLQGATTQARTWQRQLFVVAPLLRDSPTPVSLARSVVMFTQDRELSIPVREDTGQARLKATLNELGVCMSAAVKCPLPQLDTHDRLKVRLAVARIRLMSK